jgi:hypothetical protein
MFIKELEQGEAGVGGVVILTKINIATSSADFTFLSVYVRSAMLNRPHA